MYNNCDNNSFSKEYQKRCAFVINAHAKKVDEYLIKKLIKIIPSTDLFYSKNIKNSEHYFRFILKKGYGKIISGGGDGTFVNAINIIRKIAREEGVKRIPAIGILSLGTGNALAKELSSRAPLKDLKHFINHKKIYLKEFKMIECNNGIITPFAGIGYDAEVLQDYLHLKKKLKKTFLSKIISSICGYIISFITITLPRYIKNRKKIVTVKVITKAKAYKIIRTKSDYKEIIFNSNQIIYNGNISLLSIGSIKYFGYGLKMFPLANYKKKFLHLRIVSCNPLFFLANINKIWNGTFYNKHIHEFLITNVEVINSTILPYQIGGDFMNYKKKVSFRVARWVIPMINIF